MKLILVILFLLLIPTSTAQAQVEEPVAGIVVSMNSYYSQSEVEQLSPIETYINNYCLLYEVDSDLVKAIIGSESNGDIRAFNTNDDGTHDKGLMQINSFNYEWLTEDLGITDFYNPRQNIQCGVYMIADLMARHTELHEILMCYNMGEKRTRELQREGIYSSKYSQKGNEKI